MTAAPTDTGRIAQRLAHTVPVEITADGIRLRDDLAPPDRSTR